MWSQEKIQGSGVGVLSPCADSGRRAASESGFVDADREACHIVTSYVFGSESSSPPPPTYYDPLFLSSVKVKTRLFLVFLGLKMRFTTDLLTQSLEKFPAYKKNLMQ